MIKKYISIFLSLFTLLSCSGQTKEQKQQDDYYAHKANEFANKYLPLLKSYREVLYNDYFIKITPNDYGTLHHLYGISPKAARNTSVLKKNIKLDSLLLTKVHFTETFIYQEIEYWRRADINKNTFDFISWISNSTGKDYWDVKLRFNQKFREYQKVYEYSLGYGEQVRFYRDKLTGDNIIWYNIIANKNKMPISLDIFLKESASDTD